jgi:hypothetical protein
MCSNWNQRVSKFEEEAQIVLEESTNTNFNVKTNIKVLLKKKNCPTLVFLDVD